LKGISGFLDFPWGCQYLFTLKDGADLLYIQSISLNSKGALDSPNPVDPAQFERAGGLIGH
jgi:hypothetical protein